MIKDVVIKDLKKLDDDRGWLIEIWRDDESDFMPKMSYASFTKFNQIRGPHEHVAQSDYFCFYGPGDFEMYLWDDREGSESYGEELRMVVGESNPVVVIVPPGVVHGYKCISESGAWYVNLPNKLYAGKNKDEKVDEIRHEETGSKFKIS